MIRFNLEQLAGVIRRFIGFRFTLFRKKDSNRIVASEEDFRDHSHLSLPKGAPSNIQYEDQAEEYCCFRSHVFFLDHIKKIVQQKP